MKDIIKKLFKEKNVKKFSILPLIEYTSRDCVAILIWKFCHI